MLNAEGAGILGVGMAVPERVLTNAELQRMVDTTDDWIRTRTGIGERRVAGPDDTASSLGIAAARRALEDAGIAPERLDLVICATASGDYVWPATACLIQAGIGALRAGAYDLSAACAGFVYGLAQAAALVRAGMAEYVLVVGTEVITRQVNWADRNTCVLFGDGAAAAVVGACAPGEGVLASALGADGRGAELVYIPAGGTRSPVTADAIEGNLDKITMHGAEVFKFAVRIMGQVSLEALERAGLRVEDVSLFIPHQANLRIIRAAEERMGLEPERVFLNVDRYGNTSAASVPIALAEAVKAGQVRRGDVLVLVAFGAGLTWGANVLRWCKD